MMALVFLGAVMETGLAPTSCLVVKVALRHAALYSRAQALEVLDPHWPEEKATEQQEELVAAESRT